MVRPVYRSLHHTSKDIMPAVQLLRLFPSWSGIVLNPKQGERVGR